MSTTEPHSAADGHVTLADRVVGTVLVLSAAVNIIAARSTVFVLPALTLAALAFVLYERRPLTSFLKLPQESLPIAVFLSLAILSSAWSADSAATLQFTVLIFTVFLQWHIINRWVWTDPLYRIRHFAYWIAIAILVGVVVLLFEVLGDQYGRRLLIDNFGILTPPTLQKHWQIDASGHSHIREFELNRSVAAANMLLWPGVLCALSWWSGRKFQIVAGVLCASVVLATLASRHETSKLAILVSLPLFALALYRPRAAVIATGICWVVLLVAVPFAANIAYNKLELHKASWLQHSARERIVIWSDIADRVQEAPVFGVGARTGYVLSNRSKQNFQPPAKNRARAVARHAHNVYLQTWFELGIVGAMLFLVAGLAVIRAIGRLEERVQPFAIATFAVFMTEIASTWEIWQRWYAALFALTAIYLVIGVRSMAGKPADDTAGEGARPANP
jgi:hypothetical protein